MTTTQRFIYALAVTFGILTLLPAFASAQTVGATAQVGASAAGAAVSASTTLKLSATDARAKQRGDAEIDRRVSVLTDLNTRIAATQRITDAFKQSIASAVQNQISAFGQLKAKIDADTDLATLKADVQTITSSYRIFALVVPQARIAAAADRVTVIISMMTTLGNKLATRVQAAGTAGNDVSAASAALSDMGNKLSDAQTQAQAAITATASLQPDNGDKTVMASNTAALKSGRADIVAAQKDLAAARQDVATILAAIKGYHAGATASSTTQAQTQ